MGAVHSAEHTFNGAPAHSQHIRLDIRSDYVDVGIFQCVLSRKNALSAAKLKIEGTAVIRKGLVPFPSHFLGVVYVIVTGIKLRACPLFSSYSHLNIFPLIILSSETCLR